MWRSTRCGNVGASFGAPLLRALIAEIADGPGNRRRAPGYVKQSVTTPSPFGALSSVGPGHPLDRQLPPFPAPFQIVSRPLAVRTVPRYLAFRGVSGCVIPPRRETRGAGEVGRNRERHLAEA